MGGDRTPERGNLMTNREFYEAVVAAKINDELTQFATEAIAKLDHTNELRKQKNAEKAIEKDAM